MRRPIVKNQKDDEVTMSTDFTKWSETHRATPLDNPDMLEYNDANTLYGTGKVPPLAELIVEQFTDSKGDFPILSEKENLILRMYIEGVTVTDIAKTFLLRKQTVSSYLKRSGKKLKKLTNSLNF